MTWRARRFGCPQGKSNLILSPPQAPENFLDCVAPLSRGGSPNCTWVQLGDRYFGIVQGLGFEPRTFSAAFSDADATAAELGVLKEFCGKHVASQFFLQVCLFIFFSFLLFWASGCLKVAQVFLWSARASWMFALMSCACSVSVSSMQYIFMILVLEVHGLFQCFFLAIFVCFQSFILYSLEVICIMVVWLIVNPCVLFNVSFSFVFCHMSCIVFPLFVLNSIVWLQGTPSKLNCLSAFYVLRVLLVLKLLGYFFFQSKLVHHNCQAFFLSSFSLQSKLVVRSQILLLTFMPLIDLHHGWLVCYPYLLGASTCFLFCFCHMSFLVFALCLFIPCNISLWSLS